MILEVLNYYILTSHSDLDIDFKNNTVSFVTLKGLCSNTIEYWELDKGQLFLCEMYSKFSDHYERSYSDYYFKDNQRTFHNWINCEILVLNHIIPNNTYGENTHTSIIIENGYLVNTRQRIFYEDSDNDQF